MKRLHTFDQLNELNKHVEQTTRIFAIINSEVFNDELLSDLKSDLVAANSDDPRHETEKVNPPYIHEITHELILPSDDWLKKYSPMRNVQDNQKVLMFEIKRWDQSRNALKSKYRTIPGIKRLLLNYLEPSNIIEIKEDRRNSSFWS